MSDQTPQAHSKANNPNSEQGSSQEVDVSVVIVNYNVKDFLSQALRSVYQAAEGLKVEVFVVDNNSIDASVAMVQRDYPLVTLIANNENVGFGKANNQAIRLAKGRHILILNPDTIVQEDSLRAMAEFMDSHPDCGALGCQILNPDGSFAPESRRSFPTPEIAFFRMIGMSSLFPSSKRFGKYNLTYISKEEECEVDVLSGSCMMV
ncbi:glycosyltransferase family 2 protein [bacterium]|nr:glycosyltransferase family 2 protein [bacterium]